jgi:hypothetical protein
MAAGTIPPGPRCAQPHPLIASGDGLIRLPAQPEPWPDHSLGIRGAPPPRFAAVNSLGTADPAMMPGHFGLRDAEGIHLVLRREGEADRWTGRRRRADRAGAHEPGGLGRHTVPRRPTALDTAEHRHVFVLRGGEPGALASQLDVIAASADVLSDAGLDGLARQLAIGALEAGDHPAPLRVALTAATPRQLAARAQCAARLLRAHGPAAATATATATARPPDVRISAGAAGAVVVLFPGRAESAADQPTLFAASLRAVRRGGCHRPDAVPGPGQAFGIRGYASQQDCSADARCGAARAGSAARAGRPRRPPARLVAARAGEPRPVRQINWPSPGAAPSPAAAACRTSRPRPAVRSAPGAVRCGCGRIPAASQPCTGATPARCPGRPP